ncbi:TolC family protein [Duncaniella freteri]|jgi:outer membrane protein|uniref:TolC family protein n=12 Tax=Duncaniella TaxID=2518495 RepID=A0A4Z0V723_9BACT|nr:TolC family protein [Duncaniella freteri]NBJ05600.1 TolC family protein [Alistipes sp. Z76]NCE67633.1 TolC family protein [Muribaculaceae bacterium M3]TGG39575.1 TolC family protein [Duncaniella freteri]
MKITGISILSALLISAALPAKAETWSLDSCINYAIDHNLDVRSALIERYKGDLNVTEAKDRFLPTLSASAAQSWSFGRGLTSENTYANRNTSSTGFNVSFSLPIFQGLSALRQLRQAQANIHTLDLRVENAKDDVTLGVIAYYLQVLYSREIVSVRKEELRLAQTQLERQQILFEGDKVPEVDVLQAKSQVASSQVAVVNAENDYSLALVDLTRALELKGTEDFDVEPIDLDGELPRLASADEVYKNALNNNSGILAARSSVGLADHAISIAKTGYIPKLSFNAGLGSNYYTMSGMPSNSFGRQMRDNFSKSLGFSLNVPIFDAFNTRNQIRQARAQKLSAELELERQESNLLKTIRQAHSQAEGAEAQYRAGETAVTSAKAALDAMTEKFTYGRANATEWEQARSNYITTLSQQVQAKYEMILRNRILNFYNKVR